MTSTPVPALHVALVGCGRWGSNILRDLKLLGVRVTVVARSEASRARAVAGAADAIVDAVERVPVVDAFYVATTISTHAGVVLALAGRGVPMFVEKPLCCRLADAEEIARVCGDRVFVLDKWRYHPGVEALAEIATSGSLGRPVGLISRRIGWSIAHPDASTLWALAPHDLAISLEIFGRVLPLRAAGGEHRSNLKAGFVALLGDETAWHSIEVSDHSPMRSRLLRLICEGGVAELRDPLDAHIHLARIDGRPDCPHVEETRTISPEMPLMRNLRATLGYLHGGQSPMSGMADAVLVIRRLAEIEIAAGLVR